MLVFVSVLLTCKGNDKNDGNVNEEELEVSQIAQNLYEMSDELQINSTSSCNMRV